MRNGEKHMKKLLALMRQAPRRTSAVLMMVAMALIAPLALNAWGPERKTFTIQSPASYITFNSITDNPNIGDERNFVGIRESGTNNLWSDEMTVQDGKEYTVRMYVHNNAAENLNLVAQNVTAQFNVPTTTAKSIQVNGFISASNMGTDKSGAVKERIPDNTVYDHAVFNSERNFNLVVVPGSIIYENNRGTFSLSENIFTSTGVKLGYDKMDGKIPGCFKYDGYVTFKVKPQIQKTTNFEFVKKVSKKAANKWTDSYTAQPGEVVDFMLSYKNTGEVQHDDTTFRDTLPNGLTYVANSAKWSNARQQNVAIEGTKLVDGTGVNVGSYAPGANAWVTFSAKVADKSKLDCGKATLKNVAKVTTGGYSVEDNATVIVKKECEPEKPVAKYTCDSLSVRKIERTKFEFDTAYTVQNATLKHVTYVVRDQDGSELYRGTDTTFETQTPGTYSVKAFVTVVVDGEDKTVTSELCEKEFTVKQPPVTPPESIKVCELKTHTIITIDEDDFDANLHTRDLRKCDVTPVTPPVTPEVPHELPETGLTQGAMAVTGLASLVASAGYYIASRRSLGA